MFQINKWLLFTLCVLAVVPGEMHAQMQQRIGPTVTRRAIEVLPPYRARVAGTALESEIDPAQYYVGPGDAFLVSIVGVDPVLFQVTVSPAEELIILEVGGIDVKGLTAAQVRERVLARMNKLYPAFKVDCSLYGIREVRVSITGGIKKPGLHVVTPLMRVSDLITQAGGADGLAALHRVEVHKQDGSTIEVDITRFLESGEIKSNPPLNQVRQVFVPYADLQTETVLLGGIASAPVYTTFHSGETLRQLLDRSYTPGNHLEVSEVEITRIEPDGTRSRHRARSRDYDTFILQPGDQIFLKPIEGVMVVGEVQKPGLYHFQPGYTAADYLFRAVGPTREGAPTRVVINREDGSRKRGLKTTIRRGDVIHVPRSTQNVLVGQTGLIQVALAVLNMYLAFLAASK